MSRGHGVPQSHAGEGARIRAGGGDTGYSCLAVNWQVGQGPALGTGKRSHQRQPGLCWGLSFHQRMRGMAWALEMLELSWPEAGGGRTDWTKWQ